MYCSSPAAIYRSFLLLRGWLGSSLSFSLHPWGISEGLDAVEEKGRKPGEDEDKVGVWALPVLRPVHYNRAEGWQGPANDNLNLLFNQTLKYVNKRVEGMGQGYH
jgi:hypothetical protein